MSKGNIGQVLNTIELINKETEHEKTLNSAHSRCLFLHTAMVSITTPLITDDLSPRRRTKKIKTDC